MIWKLDSAWQSSAFRFYSASAGGSKAWLLKCCSLRRLVVDSDCWFKPYPGLVASTFTCGLSMWPELLSSQRAGWVPRMTVQRGDQVSSTTLYDPALEVTVLFILQSISGKQITKIPVNSRGEESISTFMKFSTVLNINITSP